MVLSILWTGLDKTPLNKFLCTPDGFCRQDCVTAEFRAVDEIVASVNNKLEDLLREAG